MKHIFLDTSFLVHCAQWKLDFISEIDRIVQEQYKFVVVSPVFEELTRLEHEKGELKFTAKLAQSILKLLGADLLESTQKTADQAILEFAKKENLVATHDAELKRKLKAKSIHSLVIRQKKYIELV